MSESDQLLLSATEKVQRVEQGRIVLPFVAATMRLIRTDGQDDSANVVFSINTCHEFVQCIKQIHVKFNV